ncbi:MAG: Cna B-type, partial [Phycisphaerales bacterium]|nr:Cna B-type [Phycisphaerales bacterium]
TWGSGEVGVAGRTVYIDSNTNGTLDAGERSAVTASNGKYIFTGVGAGTYTLREILPSGWTQTRPTAGSAIVTKISDGVARSGLDFYTTGGTVTPPPPPPPPPPGTASITAYVINDTIRDGKWSSGEKGIAGRTVWLDLDNDNVKDANETAVTTGTNGVFSFTNLAAGQYFVRQVIPAGWIQTYPAASGALTITLTAGQAKTGSSLGTALA